MRVLHRCITLLGVLVLTSSCDISNISDALEDFNVVIEPEPIDYFATIHIFDAKTEAVISSPITVTIGEEVSGQVIDILSDPIDSETVDNGVFTFGYDGKVSSESPVEIPLTITSNQYETLEFSVILSDSTTFLDVSLIDPNNLPSFLKKGTETLNLSSDGLLVDSINVPLDENGTFFEVGSGFSVTDDNGSIISGTPQLNVSLHNFTVYEESFNDERLEGVVLFEDEPLVPLSRVDIQVNGGVAKQRSQQSQVSSVAERPTYRIRHKFISWLGWGQKDIVDIENYRFMYQTKKGLLKTLVQKTIRDYEFIEAENVHFMTFDFEVPTDANNDHTIWIMRKSPRQCFLSDLKVTPDDFTSHATLYRTPQYGYYGYLYRAGFVSIEDGFISKKEPLRYDNWGSLRNDFGGREPGEYFLRVTERGYSKSKSFDVCDKTTPIEFPGLFDDIEARVELACKNPNEKLRVSNMPMPSMSYKPADGNPDGREGWVRTTIRQYYNSSTMALVFATFPIYNVDLVGQPTYYFKLHVGDEVIDRTFTIDSGNFTYTETVDVEFCR